MSTSSDSSDDVEWMVGWRDERLRAVPDPACPRRTGRTMPMRQCEPKRGGGGMWRRANSCRLRAQDAGRSPASTSFPDATVQVVRLRLCSAAVIEQPILRPNRVAGFGRSRPGPLLEGNHSPRVVPDYSGAKTGTDFQPPRRLRPPSASLHLHLPHRLLFSCTFSLSPRHPRRL